jgi:hypothetical protein
MVLVFGRLERTRLLDEATSRAAKLSRVRIAGLDDE